MKASTTTWDNRFGSVGTPGSAGILPAETGVSQAGRLRSQGEVSQARRLRSQEEMSQADACAPRMALSTLNRQLELTTND